FLLASHARVAGQEPLVLASLLADSSADNTPLAGSGESPNRRLQPANPVTKVAGPTQ
ncbi:MAG: hypothetical protein RL419_105, partial [Actinomycetota bacterium]